MFPTSLGRATLLGSVLLTLIVAPAVAESVADASVRAPAVQPATAISSSTSSASTDAERVALRDAIWQLERSLRRQLAAADRGLPPTATHRRATERPDHQRDRLAGLRRAARRLGVAGAELVRKAGALEPLLYEVERRERVGTPAQRASVWSVDAPTERLDAAAGAACGEAAEIGKEPTLVEVGDGSHSTVWLRHRAEAAGMLLVSTAGSDLDTVVEVYDGCPASGALPVAAGDDEIGFQARATWHVAAGETSWIRISGWEGAKGTAVVAIVDAVSGFAGKLTREDNGQPLGYRHVEVWEPGGAYAGSTQADSSGDYVFAGLAPGNYFASTESYSSDGVLDELYDDQPCPGGAPYGCDPATGTPIAVTAGVIFTDIDFVLGPGGEVTGRVRDAATGAALANAEVEIYSSNGNYIDDAVADVAGRYTLGGLGTGAVYAIANGGYGSQYQPELYRDIACANYSCNLTTGTPIAVAVGQTTSGVDFTLDKLGAIAGTLTRVQGGSPIPYGEVEIWDSQGHFVTWTYVQASGQYSVGGLDPGTYFASTYTDDYLDELYDNLPCDSSCTPTSGTPIAVTMNHTSSGINFALRKKGSISGTLTQAAGGAPISDYAYVYVYDNAGNLVTYDYYYNGAYTIDGLDAGTYRVFASAELYRGELYNDIPCHGGPPSGCSLSAGTPVVAQLDATTGGINFALTRLGSIAGTVSDQVNGAPLSGASVSVWNAAGQTVAYGYTNASGAYEAKGLVAGTYYVTAQASEHLPELYNNLNCPGGGPPTCNPASGTPVSVSLAATTNGVSFTLARKGTIAGTVRDLSTALPLGAEVTIYNAAGNYVAYTYTSGSGTYEVKGLDSGNYFVIARASGHSTRLYNGLPCPGGYCNPTAGNPVPVTVGVTTGGIDLSLPRLGTITGIVTSDAGPLSSIQVSLYDAGGDWQGYTYTGVDGRYQLSAEQGTWFLVAGSGGSDYVAELYYDIFCSGGCDVTTGTPVGVALGATTSGIDFKLDPTRGILGCVVGDTGQPLQGVAIDLWSATGTHLATALTGASGCYRLLPNDTGTYFVSTDSGLALVEEVWNNMSCPLGSAYAGRCNPTAGTPINLPNWSSLVTGIDFALDVGRIFKSGFESGDGAWLFSP